MLNRIEQLYASYENASEIIKAFYNPEIHEEAEGMRWAEMSYEESLNWQGPTWYDCWRIQQHKAGIISRRYRVEYKDLIDIGLGSFEQHVLGIEYY
jgi:hypothetical protein